MTIERIKIESKDQWLTLRKFDVTASVLGAIDGHDPYVSPLRLYLEKRGVELPQKPGDSPVLRRGRLFENAVAAAVAEMRPDWTLEKCTHYYRDNFLGLGATPDYYLHAGDRSGILQIKTVTMGVFDREWSEDTAPVRTMIQIRAETMLTGADFGAIAVMIMSEPNYPVYIIEVPRDEAEENKIRETVTKFWQTIQDGNQPEPDYSLDKALIAAMAPHETEQWVIDLSQDNEVVSGLLERAELRAKIKAEEERCEQIEALLMDKMQDAAIAKVPGFSVTWRTEQRKGYTVAPKESRVLRIREKQQ
jgi:predicted phage-related endonuclease